MILCRYTPRCIRHVLSIVFALVGLALLVPSATSAAQGTFNITGVIYLSDSRTLPSNAIVTIQLADVTTAGAAPTVITEQIFSTAGAQAPFAFTLPYAPAQIVPTRRYILQGNIRQGGEVLYTTRVPYPVLTAGSYPPSNQAGATRNVQITMYPLSTSGLPQASGGGLPLLIAAGLLCAGLASMALRLGLRRAASRPQR